MLTYFEAGSGTPVVFLHGNPDCKEGWQATMELLSEQFHCIAPDLPGFGKNAKVPSFRALLPDAQAKALEELLDYLHISEPIIVVAHDLGALMAISFVMEKPERVRALLSINTTFQASYPGHLWGYLWALPVLGTAFAALMRVGFAEALRKESPLVDEKHLARMVDNLNWTTCRAISRYYFFMYNPLVKIIQSIRGVSIAPHISLRVLWGEDDHYIPQKYARLANEPMEVVKHCTHWLPLERPDLVAQEVRKLIIKES